MNSSGNDTYSLKDPQTSAPVKCFGSNPSCCSSTSTLWKDIKGYSENSST